MNALFHSRKIDITPTHNGENYAFSANLVKTAASWFFVSVELIFLGPNSFDQMVSHEQLCVLETCHCGTSSFWNSLDSSETWTSRPSMPWTTEDSKVVADGLTLFRGAQLAIDTTMVSPLHCDGSARRRVADVDGAALEAARRRKERTYPELAGDGGRARLVVLAAEVGGRWSTETAQFLSALAKARALSVPQVLQGRVEAAWIRRWSAILACSAARAFSLSLDQRHRCAKFPPYTKCCGMTGSRGDGL